MSSNESPTENAPIVTLQKVASVSDEDVNREIQRIWAQLQADPAVRRSIAAEAGVSEELLVGPSPPFTAGSPGSNYDVATAVAIFVGEAAVKALIASAMAGIWKQVIWPRIRNKFGAKLEPDKDD